MSKADDLLKALKDSIGEWTCAYCGSNSNQPAATFRELKKQGYKFEEVAPQRWGKTMYCENCGTKRTHYKLLEEEPVFEEKPRITITPVQRKRVLDLFDGKDALTGASISSTPEIDHKKPWTRMECDIDIATLTDSEVFEHFQLLTREHNLLKDRACRHCKTTNLRTPVFGIRYWYAGNENYEGSCNGCGWYDGKKWREEINKILGNN